MHDFGEVSYGWLAQPRPRADHWPKEWKRERDGTMVRACDFSFRRKFEDV